MKTLKDIGDLIALKVSEINHLDKMKITKGRSGKLKELQTYRELAIYLERANLTDKLLSEMIKTTEVKINVLLSRIPKLNTENEALLKKHNAHWRKEYEIPTLEKQLKNLKLLK